MKNKTYAVIGGAGNLGSYIIDTLLVENKVPACDVLCLDLVPSDKVRTVVVDISEPDSTALQDTLENINIVFHAASIIDIRPVPSTRMQQVNVQGTINVVKACQHVGVQVLVYTSSMEVVSGILSNGNLQLGGSENDDYPARHFLPYAATKAHAERIVLSANTSRKFKTVVLRPGYIVGPGCIGIHLEISRAFQRSAKHPCYVTSQVPACISCVFVKNCAVAHILAAEKAIDNPEVVCGQAFFIKDFDANAVQVAVSAFEGSAIQVVILPFWLAYGIAWIVDRIDRFLHWLCAILGTTWTTSDNVIDIHAVDLGYLDILVSSERARDVLGYGDSVRGQKLASKEECFYETREWAHEYI